MSSSSDKNSNEISKKNNKNSSTYNKNYGSRHKSNKNGNNNNAKKNTKAKTTDESIEEFTLTKADKVVEADDSKNEKKVEETTINDSTLEEKKSSDTFKDFNDEDFVVSDSNDFDAPLKNNALDEEKSDTNVFDIVIDDKRLADKDSLDLSFLDSKASRAKIVDDSVDYKEKAKELKEEVRHHHFQAKDIMTTSRIVILAFVLGFLICFGIYFPRVSYLKKHPVEKVVVEKKIVNDDNFVFLGDSIFELYDLKKFYPDLPVVNSGEKGDTAEVLLENIEDRVYKYNPSKVILLIGVNDINRGRSDEEILADIEGIISGIKNNREKAEIYVQTIYPVDEKMTNTDITNDRVQSVNKKIKELCKEYKVEYMDIYSSLIDGYGMLGTSYTTDGLHLSNKGYEVVTRETKKILEE